jgi:hypothetical protein
MLQLQSFFNFRGEAMKKILIVLSITLNVMFANSNEISQAHQKALEVYNLPSKDFYKSIYILEKANIQKILNEKPDDMEFDKYVEILNDYAFFLTLTHSNTYIKINQCNAKKILKRVIGLDPNRIVAYLNLGDLHWNMQLTDIELGHIGSATARATIPISDDKECIVGARGTDDYFYAAKQYYKKYEELMTKANMANKIPSRLKDILKRDKLFIVTYNEIVNKNDEVPNICKNYIDTLNDIPEYKINVCDKSSILDYISNTTNDFIIVKWNDLDDVDKKYIETYNKTGYLKDITFFDYKQHRFVDRDGYSIMDKRKYNFGINHSFNSISYYYRCEYGLFDLSKNEYSRVDLGTCRYFYNLNNTTQGEKQ